MNNYEYEWNYELKAYWQALEVANSGMPMTLYHDRIDGILSWWG